MKHSFFGYFIFLSLLLLPQKSFSDLYLEPYLGFGALVKQFRGEKMLGGFHHKSDTIKAEKKNNSWPIIKSGHIRTVLGGRVGWSKLGLAFGLDLSGSFYSTLPIFGGILSEFWTVLPGAFLSYQFPVFFRVYGTLIPHGFIMSAVKENCSRHCSRLPENIQKEKPVIRSLKLGVGYTGFPFLNINLEYQPFYFIATGDTKREGFWTHGITAYVSYIF